MANPKKATHRLLQVEGTYSDHHDDPGGETMFGISREYWPEYWQDGPPDLQTAYEFYDAEFWQPLQLDEVHDQSIAYEIFEQAVNYGEERAVRFAQLSHNLSVAQRSRHIAVDGDLGRETIKHLNRLNWHEANRWIKFANGCQFMYYVHRAGVTDQIAEHFDVGADPNAKSFIRGWVGKRVEGDMPKIDFSRPEED